MKTKLETIKERAVRVAFRLGAGAVRVAPAQRDAESRRRMESAFARGDFAAWGYDEAYARRACDPESLLRDARSVVCIALAYARPSPRTAAPLSGRVSNYAWSADYHVRLRELLRAVAGEIDAAAGSAVTAIACDTKPLAERALAASSGLGWVGKHTNVIAPSLGSFVFLGEVVTTLALPADAPLRKSCGACVRCVDACPTQALRGNYTIDANRCISDLTQRTGSIPRAMRALVGDWIWGCDLCQLACPPSASAPNGAREWAPRDDRAARPPLVELLRMRNGEYKRRYRATAMGWRGAAVLRRNAAVALGNALDRSAVGALGESLCDDPHPMVRGHAAWALGRIGSPAAIAALRRQRSIEPRAGVLDEIRCALEGSP